MKRLSPQNNFEICTLPNEISKIPITTQKYHRKLTPFLSKFHPVGRQLRSSRWDMSDEFWMKWVDFKIIADWSFIVGRYNVITWHISFWICWLTQGKRRSLCCPITVKSYINFKSQTFLTCTDTNEIWLLIIYKRLDV